VIAFSAKPRRHRPVNPHAAANALALQHRDIAATVAGNISRRTGHPKDNLEQIAMLGIIQAARRYSQKRVLSGHTLAPMAVGKCITTSAKRGF
jgi:DNA-directed RNA polymerase specialized sigma subunit